MDTVTAAWLKAIFYILFANVGIGVSHIYIDVGAAAWEFWLDLVLDVGGFVIFGGALWIALKALPDFPVHDRPDRHQDKHDDQGGRGLA